MSLRSDLLSTTSNVSLSLSLSVALLPLLTLGRFTSCATPRAFAQVRAPLSQLPSLCCPSSSSSSQISGKLRDTERSSPVRTAAVVPSTRELERRSRSAGRGVCKKQVLRTALRFRKLAAADCRQSLIATRDVRASYSAVRWTVLASSSRLLSLRHHHRHRWKEGEETHPLPTPLFVVVVVDPVTECHFERSRGSGSPPAVRRSTTRASRHGAESAHQDGGGG